MSKGLSFLESRGSDDADDIDDPVIGLDVMMAQETEMTNTVMRASSCKSESPDSGIGSKTSTDQTGFIGLTNSGMTCYMNSLLQTLFMTPEFRNALFQWKFEGSSDEAQNSIPYQLQRLFVQLCVTSQKAVTTLGLTKSFGWQSAEVFQQQDIHELCRVMFDALEKKLGSGQSVQSAPDEAAPGDPDDYVLVQHAPTHDLINRLYQGQRSNRVRCCVCQSVSTTPATFLDIQIPLRPFGSDAKSYASLDDAFRAMLKPERLDGSNQYYCCTCGQKQDALVDCVYERMPYLLSLQLMRFTFDMHTEQRIKLNDRVSFPLDEWDVTEYIVPASSNPAPVRCYSNDSAGDTSGCFTDAINDRVCCLNENTQPCHQTRFQNNHSTGSNVTELPEDEDFGLDTDSGANSALNSPFGVSSSASPPQAMNEDCPHHLHESMEADDGDNQDEPDQQPTITVGQNPRICLPFMTRALTEPLATDDEDNDDDDDGFGTGETRSMCSSVYDNHNTQRPQFTGLYLRSRQASLTAVYSQSGTSDRTPTKMTVTGRPYNNSQVLPIEQSSSSSGKCIYQLFSVVVHSGSISGGHYCAYIRYFADNQWYFFNDGHVTRATVADLESSFGSDQCSYTSKACAYYLMYRRKDLSSNEKFMSESEFPPHILEMAEAIRAEEAEEEVKRLRALSLCKVPVCTRCPITQELVTSSINVYKDQTMTEATEIARTTLLPAVPNSTEINCRLIRYSTYHDCFGQSVDYAIWHRLPSKSGDSSAVHVSPNATEDCVSVPRDNKSPCTQEPKTAACPDTLSPLRVEEFVDGCRPLWLEHRLNVPGAIHGHSSAAYAPWRTYEPKGITFRLCRVDVGRELVYPPVRIWMSPNSTLGDLILEALKVYNNQPGSANCAPENIDQITVLTDWRLESGTGCALWPPVGERSSGTIVRDLSETGTVLYTSGDLRDRLNRSLMDLFPDAVFDFEQRFHGNHQAKSVLIAIDLGPQLDGLPISTTSSSFNQESHWASTLRPVGLKTPNDHSYSICRLCQMRLLFNRFSHCVTVTIRLPTRKEVCLLKLQRELLNASITTGNDSSDQPAVYSQSVESGLNSDCHKRPITHMLGQQSQDDMGVKFTSSGKTMTGFCGSPQMRSAQRRRSNSFSTLGPVPTDLSLHVGKTPVCSSTAATLSSHRPDATSTASVHRRDSQHSSNEYFFVSRPDSVCPNSALQCTGCPDAVTLSAHRTFMFEPRAFDNDALSDSCVTTYSASVDQWIDRNECSQRLAEYLDCEPECLKITRVSGASLGVGSLRANEQLTVTLKSCVSQSDVELIVYVLDLAGISIASKMAPEPVSSSPVWSEPLRIICRLNWTVNQVLEAASVMLTKLHQLNIPMYRLCLRKCYLPECCPGPLLNTTSQLASFRSAHQGVLVQLLDIGNQPIPSTVSVPSATTHTAIFIFLRRWYPSTLTFAPSLQELAIPFGSNRHECWINAIKQLCVQYGISFEQFRFAACKFPGRMHCLNMEAMTDQSVGGKGLKWMSPCSDASTRSVPANGQVVYFKDASEPCKTLSPDELQSYRVGFSSNTVFKDSSSAIPAALTYGPSLPLTSGAGPELSNPFATGSIKRTHEQPLRIYTAEDAPPKL